MAQYICPNCGRPSSEEFCNEKCEKELLARIEKEIDEEYTRMWS